MNRCRRKRKISFFAAKAEKKIIDGLIIVSPDLFEVVKSAKKDGNGFRYEFSEEELDRFLTWFGFEAYHAKEEETRKKRQRLFLKICDYMRLLRNMTFSR